MAQKKGVIGTLDPVNEQKMEKPGGCIRIFHFISSFMK